MKPLHDPNVTSRFLTDLNTRLTDIETQLDALATVIADMNETLDRALEAEHEATS